MKSTLLDQFKHKEISSDFTDIQVAWDDYHKYVESIGRMSCVVRSPEEVVVSAGLTPESLTILLSKARQIDKMVSRWLVSTDLIERHDMEAQCENLISEINAMIVKNTGRTPE